MIDGFFCEFTEKPDHRPDKLTARQVQVLAALSGASDEEVFLSEDEVNWLLQYGFISPLVRH